MLGLSELTHNIYNRILEIDKNLLLICIRVFNICGFLNNKDHPYSSIMMLAVYYNRLFCIYFSLSSIMPLISGGNVAEFGERANFTFMAYYVVITAFVILKNSDTINNLLYNLSNPPFDVKRSHYKNIAYTFYMYGFSFFFNILNIIQSLIEHSGNFGGIWLPYDVQQSPLVYYATSVMIFLSSQAVTAVFGFGTAMFSCILSTFADLFICLQSNISKISDVDRNVTLNERDEIIRERFYECVSMHNWILSQYRLSRGVLEIFSSLRTTLVVFVIGSGATIILLELMDHNLRGIFPPLLLILACGASNHFIFTQSNDMKEESSEVANAWYGCGWEQWPRDLRVVIPFVIARAQTPVVYRAFKIWEYNRELFLQILSNCYTMFMFAREML